MSDYTPDKWVILEISSEKDGTYRKILSSWYSGYLGNDEWRLSSSILKQSTDENYFHFTTESNSLYSCNKKAYGMSLLTTGVLNKMVDQCKENNSTIKIVEISELEGK